MALLQRADVRAPVVRKESVDVPALGGEVIVCSLLLADRLALSALQAELAAVPAQPGETPEQAHSRAGGQIVFHTLARTVVLGDGLPLYTPKEWNEFGAAHPDAVLGLYRKSRALSGHDDETNLKN